MNRKVILLFALILLGALILGCAQQEKKPETTPKAEKTPTPKKTTPPKAEKTPSPEKTPTPRPKTTPKKAESKGPVVECTVCHSKANDYVPHLQGGQLCGNCHGWDPHKIHVGPGTINIDCQVCHGTPDKISIPQPIEEGRTVCENCHAYPDPTKPSYGNLVNIHLPRGKYCTVCHGTDIGGLHQSANRFVEQ